MENNIDLTFKIITNALENKKGKYGFIYGHPVDLSRPKYKIYRHWFEKDRLFCFACGVEPNHFKLIQCKSAGKTHKPSGRIKHTYQLYSKNGVLFTLDHWYPKWFLKRFGMQNSMDNMVPMCEPCNKKKKMQLPLLGLFGNTFHIPTFTSIIKRNLHTRVRYS